MGLLAARSLESNLYAFGAPELSELAKKVRPIHKHIYRTELSERKGVIRTNLSERAQGQGYKKTAPEGAAVTGGKEWRYHS